MKLFSALRLIWAKFVLGNVVLSLRLEFLGVDLTMQNNWKQKHVVASGSMTFTNRHNCRRACVCACVCKGVGVILTFSFAVQRQLFPHHSNFNAYLNFPSAGCSLILYLALL